MCALNSDWTSATNRRVGLCAFALCVTRFVAIVSGVRKLRLTSTVASRDAVFVGRCQWEYCMTSSFRSSHVLLLPDGAWC